MPIEVELHTSAVILDARQHMGSVRGQLEPKQLWPASCVQIRVKKHFLHEKTLRVVLCPFALWSDGSQTTVGRASFHNVNIMPANWPLKHLRSKRGYKRLAELPVVDSDLKCAPRGRHNAATSALSV